jgi:hypothetical protein
VLDLVQQVERVAALAVELVVSSLKSWWPGVSRVMIGTSRSRQTSKSLRVYSSIPLAASSTITALSTAARERRSEADTQRQGFARPIGGAVDKLCHPIGRRDQFHIHEGNSRL